MLVQGYKHGRWVKIPADNDPDTSFKWKRHLAAQSRVTIEWRASATATLGHYRLVYHGGAKVASEALTPFTEVTNPFTVRSKAELKILA